MSSTVVPALHYKDAKAAIRFLVDGCSFTEKAVFEGESGRVEHAELVHGTGTAHSRFASRSTPTMAAGATR